MNLTQYAPRLGHRDLGPARTGSGIAAACEAPFVSSATTNVERKRDAKKLVDGHGFTATKSSVDQSDCSIYNELTLCGVHHLSASNSQ